MNDEELFGFIERTARPALERHVLFKSRFSLSREDIQDVVQETFLRLIKQRQMAQPSLAWLYRVADNILIDRWRKNGTVTLIPLDESFPVPPNDEDVLLKAAFRKAFFSLNENEQRVLYSMSIGQTQAEIAIECQVRQSTVAHWAKVAKERIRQWSARSFVPMDELV